MSVETVDIMDKPSSRPVLSTVIGRHLAERRQEAGETKPARMMTEKLSAFFGQVCAVREVSLEFADRGVTAIIGPSGCGKSTLLRCLNRLHETVPHAWIEGEVRLDQQNIYEPDVDPVWLRRRIGMVFQRPTTFPTMSVGENVAAGLAALPKSERPTDVEEAVEEALRGAALWDEIKDRLDDDAAGLSGGQQQRLCIARALAMRPEVILLDEPTASLDPHSTERVEDLVYELRRDYTVIIVTHNMQQAARVSDSTAFLLAGELIEQGPTGELFTKPGDPRTEAYLTGRFG
jgi:phosphate transport system ATP-binding protein